MSSPLVLPACVIDLDRHEVARGGATLALTPIEGRLLSWFAGNTGRTVSRDELLREVWGYRAGVETRTVQSTIHRIREKIEVDPAEPGVLTTVYGVGYRFEVPAPEDDGLVGRGEALVALRERLRTARLVTICGPGGVGKTTLAMRLVERDGATFCDLSASRGPHDVIRAVAAALGVEPRPGAPLDQARWIAAAVPGRCVLVLDNVEQLDADAVGVISALAAAPLAIVATSRRDLGLPAESILALEPLDPGAATRLFRARAAQVRPDLQLGDEADTRIARIVAALDCLPLAIELAAARLNILGITDLEARTGEALGLLGGGTPGRHASIEQALAWSWQLLGPDECAAMQALSVFAAPFDVDAARAVTGLQDGMLLEILETLRRNALVRRDDRGGRARFSVFATIRSFAASRLKESGLHPAVVARHARWFADRGWRASGMAAGGLREPDAALHELPELLAACEHGLALDAPTHARLALAAFRGAPAGSGPAIDDVIARDDLPRSWRALLLGARAHLDRLARAYDVAGTRLAEAFALAGDDPAVLAHLCTWQTVLDMDRGAWREAEEASRLAERHGTVADIGTARLAALSNRATLRWYLGEADALEHYERAQRLAEALGDQASLSDTLTNHGGIHVDLGRLDRALPLLLRAVQLAERVGGHRRQALALNNLAALYREQERHPEAEELFARALEHMRRATLRLEPVITRLNIGYIALERGRLDDAEIAASEAIEALKGMSRYATYAHALAAAMAHRRGWARVAAERYDEAIAGTPAADRRYVLLTARRAVLERTPAAPLLALDRLPASDVLGRWELTVHQGHAALAQGDTAAARARLEAARSPQPDSPGPTPCAWSADLRLAAALLARAIDSA